jgi:hypothetical protein
MLKMHGYSVAGAGRFVEQVIESFSRQTENMGITILSAEAFANLELEQLERVKSWLSDRFDIIRPIYYARPPGFSGFYSMFQEFVKGGDAPPASKVVRNRVFMQVEQSRKIAKVFPECNFRVFSREDLTDEDIVLDFLDATGLEGARPIVERRRSNPGLSLESVSLLFFFNKTAGVTSEEKFAVRQAIVRFDKLARQRLTTAVPPSADWEFELKLHSIDDWIEYLERAGRTQDSKTLSTEKSSLRRRSLRSDLLTDKNSMASWLKSFVPNSALVAPYIENDVREVLDGVLTRDTITSLNTNTGL